MVCWSPRECETVLKKNFPLVVISITKIPFIGWWIVLDFRSLPGQVIISNLLHRIAVRIK